MLKLTEYFLGEEATLSDIMWFYGFYAVAGTILTAVIAIN